MASVKEIRAQITSAQNIRRITHTMEMVATSRMRRAQSRMAAARPYCDRLKAVAGHLAQAHSEYPHPFLVPRAAIRRAGVILITSDKGLCGGLNANALRLTLSQIKQWGEQGIAADICAIGAKGFQFAKRAGLAVRAHQAGLGETPHIDQLIGPLTVMLNAYREGEIDALYLCYARFVSALRQEAQMEPLLPLGGQRLDTPARHWDYLYEPDARSVLDLLLERYVETLVFQAVAENMASEQASRMVAMRAATENADDMIGALRLLYNKSRQAAITKELSEIVSGAAAV
ncbi:MAG: F0F1 ATP synthase subunit gamma [Betaproteobacteria bacterium]|nr:F0F1 ATP synthase subunit gamma [Betaproteobacteria bacterium]